MLYSAARSHKSAERIYLLSFHAKTRAATARSWCLTLEGDQFSSHDCGLWNSTNINVFSEPSTAACLVRAESSLRGHVRLQTQIGLVSYCDRCPILNSDSSSHLHRFAQYFYGLAHPSREKRCQASNKSNVFQMNSQLHDRSSASTVAQV